MSHACVSEIIGTSKTTYLTRVNWCWQIHGDIEKYKILFSDWIKYMFMLTLEETNSPWSQWQWLSPSYNVFFDSADFFHWVYRVFTH